MKRICALVTALCIALCSFGCVLASEEAQAIDLGLTEAIDMAMTDNAQIIANSYRQYANQKNLESAHANKKDAVNSSKNMPILSATTINELLLKKGYYVEAAKMQQRLTIKEADKIKASIAYSVTEAYYNLVLMDKLIAAANNAHNLALANLEVIDAQYDMGLIAELDYENASLAVDNAKSMVDSYILNREIADANLKILLDIPQDTKLTLTDEIETEEFSADANTDITSALDTRYDVTAAKEAKDLAMLYFDIAKSFTSGSAVYNTAYADYIDAENTYKSALDGITLSLRSSYNKTLTTHTAMELARRQYETKLKAYEAVKLKYELGMISNLELTNGINELYDAQVSYANAKLNYRLAVEKYKYEISTGL
ncbi:MAG: TolC family protein [Clostridia bacterium]|nr:TolC family protein [Clostridia bacterium]